MKSGARAAAAMLLVSSAAMAGDRLFPTDVPSAGEADVRLGVLYRDDEYTLDSGSSLGGVSDTVEALRVRVGLGRGLSVSGATSYLSSGKRCFGGCQKIEPAFGPASFGLEWQMLPEREGPGSALLSLAYDSNSSGDESQAYAVGITGGYQLPGRVHAYGTLQRKLPQAGGMPDSSRAALGARIGAGRFAFVPQVSYERLDKDASGTTSGITAGTLEIIMPLARSVRLLPGVAYSASDGAANVEGWGVSLALYALLGDTEPVPARAPARLAPPDAGREPLRPGPFTLPRNTDLYQRPRPFSEPFSAIAAGTEVVLKTHLQKDSGNWWYVEAPRAGWLREQDLR